MNLDILAKEGGTPYRKTNFPEWPIYDESEKKLLEEVLESRNWWRVSGNKVKEFEKQFAKFQGGKHCIGVTNGTNALELAISVLGLGAGDEVIVPAMTFISTGLAAINSNVTPVLVDIDPETLCMDPNSFEAAITCNTKAVIPVHMAGNACNIDQICNIAKKHNIYVIEDAAHGHGGEFLNKRLGSFGDMAIFSFQNGKLMTCGEGGALIINNDILYEKAYLIQDVGRPKGDTVYRHVIRGNNFRMNEFQAAILLAQMERVNSYNVIRDKHACLLDKLMREIEGIVPQKKTSNANIVSHYMYMFYYNSVSFNGLSREDFVQHLNAEGIPAFVCFPVLSDVEFFEEQNFNGRYIAYDKRKELDLSNSRKAADEVVWIHHRTLEGNENDICDIAGAVKKIQRVFNSRKVNNVY